MTDTLNTPLKSTSPLTRAARLALMGVHFLYGFYLLAFRYRKLDRTAQVRLARRWSLRMLKVLGIEVVMRGEWPGEYPANTLMVANHISWLDIFALSSQTMTRFIAKMEIRHWPVVGWLVHAGGTLFIDRTNRRDASRVNQIMADALQSGDCMAVFPESTTSEGNVLLPFKSSLFESAILAGSRVQPVTLRYLDANGIPTTDPSYAGDTTFRESLAAILRHKVIRVEVTFGESLAAGTPPYDSRFALAEASRREVAAALRLSRDRPDTDGLSPLDPQAEVL
ncbi:lysophospholipid acyltransferase family protein [Paludibacterium paludis]|nr:lysophospholipid acyltransferase family protein [Paludibacterium paludis]